MLSIKYRHALSLGVVLSGLILGVSCTSLFTGATSPSDGGKQVVADETRKTRSRKIQPSVVGNSAVEVRPISNQTDTSFPVKLQKSGDVIAKPPGG